MSKRLTGINPLAYLGVESLTPPSMYIAQRAPTSSDSRNFNLGDLWIDEPNESLYVLVSLAAGVAVWVTTFGGAANTFQTDNGIAQDNNGTIQMLGDGTTITTTGSGDTVTFSLTQGADGQLLIGDSNASAEWADVTSGDNTINIIAGPHSLELTANTSVIVGNGTNGQLLIGGGSAPQWASLTSDGSIIITPGVNTLQITAPAATGLTDIDGDTGTATQAAGTVNIIGDGAMIETTGAGNTLTVSILSGTDGQLIIGKTGGPAAWGNLTSSGGTVVITEGANSINLEATGGGSSGASTFITDAGNALENLGDITIAGGSNIATSGSGQTVTINLDGTTNHSVQVGNVGGSLTSLAVGTNGQVLIGSTGANPQFSSLTSTGGTIAFTTGAGTLNLEAIGGGGGGGVIVTQFTADGTWTKNINTKYVEVYGWGGGGGGGGGGQGNTVGTGGSGASPTSVFHVRGPALMFGATETVTVGVGGSGGLGATAANTPGSNGENGTTSSFGSVTVPAIITTSVPGVSSRSGGTGGGVNVDGVSNGGGYAGIFDFPVGNIFDFFPGTTASSRTNKVPYGCAGGGASFSNGSNASNGGSDASSNYYVFSFLLPTGGGGGSPWNNNGSFNNPGGNGGNYLTFDGSTVATGGLGGQNAGAPNGANGSSMPTSGGLVFGGLGGGGGKGRFAGSTPGVGGDGGFPGGGGGGGGGSQNGTSAGNGGNGGNGLVLVIEWT